MKNFFKGLMLGLILTVFTAVGVTSTYAQDQQAEKTAIYENYTKNYKGTIEQRKTAIAAAKEYIEKFNSEVDKPIVDYLKNAIPQLEKGIKDEEAAIIKKKKGDNDRMAKEKLYKDFDTAARASNWDQVYSLGKQILADDPDLIDVTLVLGSIGLDESYKTPPVKKYNNDTITYAKIAIDKLNAGAKSEHFGAYGKYEYENKENALGWMNWTIGNLLYFQMEKEQDALPYLYKASQYKSEVQEFPDIYRAIGRWYLNKVAEKEKVRLAKLTEANNVDTPETLALLAENKGYAARAIDAYSRAYKLAKADPKTPKAYNDNLFGKLQELYKFRYDEDIMKTDAKINSDVAAIMSKPMPNPTSPVEPIGKPTPAVDGTDTTDAMKTTTPTMPTTTPTTNGAERNRTVNNNPTNTAKKPVTKPATKPTTQNKPRKH